VKDYDEKELMEPKKVTHYFTAKEKELLQQK